MENYAALATDQQQLKQAVDEYMTTIDPSYMEHVYGRGRWIRRVAKYAIHGWGDNRDDKITEWLVEEWKRHKTRHETKATLSDRTDEHCLQYDTGK